VSRIEELPEVLLASPRPPQPHQPGKDLAEPMKQCLCVERRRTLANVTACPGVDTFEEPSDRMAKGTA